MDVCLFKRIFSIKIVEKEEFKEVHYLYFLVIFVALMHLVLLAGREEASPILLFHHAVCTAEKWSPESLLC